MYSYHKNLLPQCFSNLYVVANERHNYSTRFASKSSLCLPSVRTNYGKLNIRFAGAKAWNAVDQDIKKASSISQFRKSMKKSIIDNYKNIPFDNQYLHI